MKHRKRLLVRAAATVAALTMAITFAACASSSPATNPSGAPAPSTDGPQLPADIAASGKLRLGWAALPSYAALDPATSQIEGFYADLARAIGENLGVEIVFVEDSWPTIVLGLGADKYDFTFAGRTPERETQADFTQNTIQADFTFAVKKDSGFTGMEDLDVAGNALTVTTGSNTDEALTPLVKNAEVLRVRDVGGAILSVQNDTADAMAGVRDYLIAAVAGYPELTVLDSSWGVSVQGLLVKKDNAELLDVLDAQVGKLKEDGTMQKLLDKHKLVGVEVSD